MTLDEIVEALGSIDARVYLDDRLSLRYNGPLLTTDSPLRAGIDAHRSALRRMFSTAIQRCVFNCPEVLAPGDLTACAEHRLHSDSIPMPWERSRPEAASAASSAN
jgi:hypothetical protein